MLTIWIETITGETVELQVRQMEFVVTCKYCQVPFRTINPDQMYCKRSHGQRAYEIRRDSAPTRNVYPSAR